MNKQSVQKKKAGKPRKKIIRNVPAGIAHVLATPNNTIITITDPVGEKLASSSAGKPSHQQARKSIFAASVAGFDAGRGAMVHGMKEVEVILRGPGPGRESAVKGIASAGLVVTVITDRTRTPHNGCRARKRRKI